ncbi:inositol monophosphatase family protein [Haloarcula halophila]|uniref:inositol monophosphatase family protein n=1 Tax=Haloarcula TaxID=2237 RepID=UPI0023E3AE47|nr:inositol monophosphatase family protein [Halomicroarcula sp. DFY41]
MSTDLAPVARTAAEDAGDYLRERFVDGTTDAEYGTTDVKAHADREAERRIVDRLRAEFPDHAITAEESGHHEGDGDYRWVVDGLDGTNNFAAGIPTFGVSVAAVDADTDDPVAAAVTLPALGDTYVAVRDGGVTHNGESVSVTDGETPPVEAGTVAFVIGHPVVYDGPGRENADEIRWELGQTAKRCIQTWAPVVHWALLSRGGLDGFVCLHPDEREQIPGELLATEAGCRRRAEGPLSAFAPTGDAAEELLATAVSVREPLD